MELTLTQQVLVWAFGIAVIMGAVANKTNFCTMGAVSDMVNMGDTGRFRAWLFAIAVAIVGVMILQALSITDMSMTTDNNMSQPPYRTPNFVWPRYIVGGLLFGIGMTLGSGCGNKTMIRLGAGNLKSLFVFLAMGAGAYLMLYTSFDYYVFLQWMNPVSPNLADMGIPSQDLGAITAGIFGIQNASAVYFTVGTLIALFLLYWVLKAEEFRTRYDNILGGAVIGLAVVAGWYVTAGPLGQNWLSELEWADIKPAATGAQSFTFVAPTGQTLHYLGSGLKDTLLTFSMMGALGVLVGSFLWAIISRGFRIEWFTDLSDATRHIVGGLLMGVGGVLGMGCTVGQGITGFSTLAVGSMLTFGSIVLGSALTMKINYYRMVYEEEASFGKALTTALVDMRLLPSAMRKLEAI